jgi:hypothetical protein
MRKPAGFRRDRRGISKLNYGMVTGIVGVCVMDLLQDYGISLASLLMN